MRSYKEEEEEREREKKNTTSKNKIYKFSGFSTKSWNSSAPSSSSGSFSNVGCLSDFLKTQHRILEKKKKQKKKKIVKQKRKEKIFENY